MSIIKNSKANPHRPANWVWLRSAAIVDGMDLAAARSRDGEYLGWVKRASLLKRDIDRCVTELDTKRVSERKPELFWAYRIWDNNDSPIKAAIEARILAKQTNHEIGYAVNMSDAIINAYTHIFFDVRPHLHKRDYILHCVLHPAVRRGLSGREYDLLWKMYAYFYGPHMFEAISSDCVNPMWVTDASDVANALQMHTVGAFKVKAALAAKTISVDRSTQMELLHAFNKFVEIQKAGDGAGSADIQITSHIDAMMQNLDFLVGSRDPNQEGHPLINSPIDQFDKDGVELTFQDQVRVAAGESVPALQDLRNFEYPEKVQPATGG